MTTETKSPWEAQTAVADDSTAEQRPELLVGAALLGGFVLAKILGAIAGDD